jgi:hypothetical protein
VPQISWVSSLEFWALWEGDGYGGETERPEPKQLYDKLPYPGNRAININKVFLENKVLLGAKIILLCEHPFSFPI